VKTGIHTKAAISLTLLIISGLYSLPLHSHLMKLPLVWSDEFDGSGASRLQELELREGLCAQQ
jgi:hypothetical protein